MLIVSHYLQGVSGNIVDKLKDKGAIIPKDLVRPNGRVAHYDTVFDYEVCSPENWELQKSFFIQANVPYSYIDQAKYYPIKILENNIIYWESAYYWKSEFDRNEDPVGHISSAFPDEVLAFESYFGDRFDCGYFVKNKDVVTKDGKHIYATIDHVKSSLIGDMGNGSSRIILPYDDPKLPQDDPNRMRFVSIYTKNENISDFGRYVTMDNRDEEPERYKRIDITTPNIIVYENKKEKDSSIKKFNVESYRFEVSVNSAREKHSYMKSHEMDDLDIYDGNFGSVSFEDTENSLENTAENMEESSFTTNESESWDYDEELPFN